MKRYLPLIIAFILPMALMAFDADKYYTIHRNGESSSYIFQNGSTMSHGALKQGSGAYVWRLIPTGKPDCYYVRNAETEQYVQTSAVTLSSLVSLGDEPVEYMVSHGANTAGYYFLASTDQSIDYTTDSSLGLNKGASGVVAYYIKTGRGNSYWEIEETDYTPAAPGEVTEDDDVSPGVCAYRLPCGTLNARTYLSLIDIEGEGVLGELHYKSTAPNKRHILYTAQHVVVAKGGDVDLKAKLEGASTAGLAVTVYADFDGDGRFEQTVNVAPQTELTAKLKVPAQTDAVMGRIRIRVDKSGSVGANADVYGVCYDFPVYFGESDGERTLILRPNSAARGKAVIYGTDDTDAAYARGAEVTVQAIANRGFRFLQWRQGQNVVGSNALLTVKMTENKELTAVFAPTTEDDADCVRFTFQNTHSDVPTVVVTNQEGNVVEGVSATVMVSPSQWIKNTGNAMESATEITPNSSRDMDVSRYITLQITGLPADFYYETVRAKIAAVGSTGSYLSKGSSTTRPFSLSVSTGSSEGSLALLASIKNANLMIDATTDGIDNTHSWAFTGVGSRAATDPLCVQLELVNLTSTVCYSSLFALDILKSDKEPEAGVQQISTVMPTSAQIYDLNGRRVAAPRAPGLYITSDGKKFVK